MKIAILSNNTSSLYSQRQKLLQTLVQKGHILHVIAPTNFFVDELKQLGANVYPFEVKRHQKNPFSDLVLCYQYYKLLKKIRPEVVFSYHIKPNIYGALACQLLGIAYMPNITGLGTAVEYPGLLQKFTILLYKLAMRKAHTIFFQNSANQAFFEEHHLIREHTHKTLLPGSGVDLEKNPALLYPKEGEVHFLFVSRILKEKGIDLYLAAARKFSSPKIKFHICGGFDSLSYQPIIEQSVQEGFIVYHGRQPNMHPFFKQCSCLIHPSWYPEGMSNVLLEAAASARPVITTDRPGCREAVEEGKTGFMVPVQDEQALMHAIENFLTLPWEQRRQMGLNARAKMEKEFDRKIVVEAYLKELEGIKRYV